MGLSNYKLNAMIAVSDMTRAEAFYEDKLGLVALRAGADGSKVYASVGDEALVVYPSPDHAGGSTATLVTWSVDDVEDVVDELTSNGVTFEQYEGQLESGFDYSTNEKGISPRAGGGNVAWFKDPTGTSSRSKAITSGLFFNSVRVSPRAGETPQVFMKRATR